MMKSKTKRALALVLAVILSLSALGTAAFATEGEGPAYEYTDAYVINYAKTDLGDYAAQAPYLYASPHLGSMQIRNLDTGKMESWYTSQQVYNLINTTKLAAGGEGAYASLGAYCVDACISARGGYAYRRVNLEDSTYFDDAAAARIRSIYLHSFPYIKDLSAIEAAANAWLAENLTDYTPITGLTGAEIITATQYSIWQVANGDDVVGKRPYIMTDDYTAESLEGEVVYIQDEYVDCTEEKGDNTANNITLLNQYLLALEGMAPSQKAAADASFVSTAMAVTGAAGSYTVTVNVTVDVTVSDSDDMVLTAILGEQEQNVQLLPGTADYSFTFATASVENVYLEINGTQKVADVFLFDADGDRAASQSMVAYDDSALPVHAEAVVEPERVLNFFKTTYEPQEDGSVVRVPLEGIVFDIYFVATMDAFTSGAVTLPDAPDAADYEKVGAVTTGADGKAVFNLTQLGLEDGIYLVVEQAHPAIVEPAAPFFVAVPMMNDAGDGWNYSVTVEPKNQVVPGPDIRKDVTEIENDEDTFDVDAAHTWIIRTDIPADLAGGKRYVISDTLDHRLTYLGNLGVKVGKITDKAHTETVTLEIDTHYTLSVSTTEDETLGKIDSFTVSLTEAGMALAAQTAGEDYENYEIRVYFDAAIDSDASMGEAIPNQAQLDYINSAGYVFDAESDKPVVYTAGVRIIKFDAADETKFLAGAEFRIARPATAEEIAAGLSSKLVIGGTALDVVYPEFYIDEALTRKASSVITDENGNAIVYGLAYGQYFLVEVKAPENYHLLSSPVEVTLDDVSHLEAAAIKVANSSEFLLPSTGGSGTVILTVAGIAMLCSAAAVLLLSGKKREA